LPGSIGEQQRSEFRNDGMVLEKHADACEKAKQVE